MTKAKVASVDAILEATSNQLGVPVEILKQPSQKTKKVAYARHVAQYLALEMTFQSQKTIGAFFNQHRTSVLYGYKKIRELIRSHNDETIKNLDVIRRELLSCKGQKVR